MKTSKMLELVENLKVGEKVIIEKFKDHLFVEKKSLTTEWTAAPDDNINKHGVDLSILNEEDWFYVETGKGIESWIAQSNILEVNKDYPKHYSIDGNIMFNDGFLCDNDEITLLRKATPEDLAPFFEKYPMYAPVSVGDLGIFYDDLDHAFSNITEDKFYIKSLTKITENETRNFSCVFSRWKNFFKVHESETIAEIKERFLKEVGNDKDK